VDREEDQVKIRIVRVAWDMQDMEVAEGVV
jgi:hypothetical protein